MKVVVTGGAGFIGSHLVDALMKQGYKVTVIDNLSSGRIENIEQWLNHQNFKLVKADLKRPSQWIDCLENMDIVFHYAANPEVRVSTTNPEIHFRENLEATFNVLEACRKRNISILVFASTSTVYGEPKIIPTPEDYHPLEPISIYGSVKLACESLIKTYCKLYSLRALILRYANIIGPRSTHGVIIDFIRKLKANPRKLEILGDGTQTKSYLYIDDAVEATLKTLKVFQEEELSYDIYNIGSEDQINVKTIADIIVRKLGLKNVEYIFKPATRNGRGWLGDVKIMLLDIMKIKRKTGWKPKHNSKQAVTNTITHYIDRWMATGEVAWKR